MVQRTYSVSVPGSMMLMGEHGVLRGKAAIVCAIDKRINIRLTPNATNYIHISDTNLGKLKLSLNEIQTVKPFSFVLSAILHFKNKIKTGFDLDIDAEFSSELGLGSSAAVTAGTIAVLGEWLLGKKLTNKKIFLLARKVILQVQSVGSCADLAASVFGGVLAYQSKPLKVTQLPLIENLTAVYCGYKTPTSDVIKLVNAASLNQPKLYTGIFTAMHICVLSAIDAIKSGDLSALGKLCLQHQGLQYALGVSDQLLDNLVRELAACKGIYGAKISGSGLGDCIIGIGKISEQVFPIDANQQNIGVVQIAISVDPEGLCYA